MTATATSVPGIAGVRIVHEPLPGQSLELKYVQGDWAGGEELEEPIVVRHRIGTLTGSSTHETLHVASSAVYSEDADGRVVVRFPDVEGHAPAQTLVSVRPGYEYELLYDRMPTAPTFQHARDRNLFSIALAERRRGMLLHAAGFALPGGVGVLCPGISGTGKSTLSRLLASTGVTPLSDDRVVLTRSAGEFRIWGSPWCGDAHITNPSSAALGVVAIIRHAEVVTVREIPKRDAAHKLWNTTTLPLWSATLMDWALSFFDELLGQVRVVEIAYPAAPGTGELLVEQLQECLR